MYLACWCKIIFEKTKIGIYSCDDTLMFEEQIRLTKEICKIFVESGIFSEVVANLKNGYKEKVLCPIKS